MNIVLTTVGYWIICGQCDLHASQACLSDYYENILYQILGPILGVCLILECYLYSNKYGNCVTASNYCV